MKCLGSLLMVICSQVVLAQEFIPAPLPEPTPAEPQLAQPELAPANEALEADWDGLDLGPATSNADTPASQPRMEPTPAVSDSSPRPAAATPTDHSPNPRASMMRPEDNTLSIDRPSPQEPPLQPIPAAPPVQATPMTDPYVQPMTYDAPVYESPSYESPSYATPTYQSPTYESPAYSQSVEPAVPQYSQPQPQRQLQPQPQLQHQAVICETRTASGSPSVQQVPVLTESTPGRAIYYHQNRQAVASAPHRTTRVYSSRSSVSPVPYGSQATIQRVTTQRVTTQSQPTRRYTTQVVPSTQPVTYVVTDRPTSPPSRYVVVQQRVEYRPTTVTRGPNGTTVITQSPAGAPVTVERVPRDYRPGRPFRNVIRGARAGY